MSTGLIFAKLVLFLLHTHLTGSINHARFGWAQSKRPGLQRLVRVGLVRQDQTFPDSKHARPFLVITGWFNLSLTPGQVGLGQKRPDPQGLVRVGSVRLDQTVPDINMPGHFSSLKVGTS